mmetsp:Transcript_22738/g.38692  ORF Transcript_22738/g.38692 Transcript_22738/m.38692 type:complete len:101 (-) Transcript_22738:402-704(-)
MEALDACCPAERRRLELELNFLEDDDADEGPTLGFGGILGIGDPDVVTGELRLEDGLGILVLLLPPPPLVGDGGDNDDVCLDSDFLAVLCDIPASTSAVG